jgi:alpha-2-macroglobulin
MISLCKLTFLSHLKIKLMKMKFTLLLLFGLSIHMFTTAQTVNWGDVEIAINKSKNLADVNNRLEQIKSSAISGGNYVVVARCYNYQLQIADKKSEDSVYFKNSFFIDSILQNNNSPLLLQSIMHIMQAKRIAAYNYKFFYKGNKNLIKDYNTEVDYSLMGQVALDSLVQIHFEMAKTISLKLNDAKMEDLLWLSSDPLLFFFKPNFTDIIYAEQIYFFQISQNRNQKITSIEWLNLSPNEFLREPVKATGIPDNFIPVYKLFRQWAAYNSNQPQAFYFIETLARKYFYKRSNPNAKTSFFYEAYLQKLLTTPFSSVKAHAVYQLCLYWNSEASKYNSFNQSDDYYTRVINRDKKFDTAFRFHYVKALQLYQQNEQLLDSFSFVKNILAAMKTKILLPRVDMENMQTQLPNDSIAVLLKFKNVPVVYVNAVKIDATHKFNNNHEYNINYIKNLPVINNQIIRLPVTADYQMHNVNIKLNPLPAGRYALVYSDSAIDKDRKTDDYVIIDVTNIAVINNDEKVFVLNRTTGFPLPGATVQVRYKNESILSSLQRVNKEGWVRVKEKDVDRIYVANKEDTASESINEPDNDLPDEIYNKEEDDDLVEYYGNNIKLYMFTDRAIYRPGQMVQYKGIFLIRNPFTGEFLVLNKKNLKFPWLQKLFNSEVRDMVKEKKEIFIKDAFDRIVDTVKIRANEYGSFAGFYTIKKDAATGDWEFDNDDINIDYENRGHFKVEEYKRPSFELVIEKPTSYLQLGDSFMVRVKAKSFAGASLNNVKIKYKVNFSGDVPVSDSTNEKVVTQQIQPVILDRSGYTNSNGELEINVPSSFLKKYQFNSNRSWNAVYEITAEAIDASGESHEEILKMNLSNRPVKINYSLSKIIEHSELPSIFISAKSDYAGELKREVNINLYKYPKKMLSLKEEQQAWDYILENNLWKYTGDIATGKIEEDVPALIFSTKITTGGIDKFSFPAALMQSGVYKIEIICKEGEKIVGENSKKFSVFDKAANSLPEETASFHFLPANAAAKGETIKWFSGNTLNNVYSIYHVQYFSQRKNKIKVKYGYDLKREQKGLNEWHYTIPEDAVDEITVTHLYIFNNELYKEAKQIYINKTAATEPEIIIDQYRKKLAPGSKETFVVSIKTKNENVAAELMTTMYDASLDKIKKHQWNLPRDNLSLSSRPEWTDNINNTISNSLFTDYKNGYQYPAIGKNTEPLWWLNPLDYSYDEVRLTYMLSLDEAGMPGAGTMLTGRAAGLNITSTDGLNEVVVTGYGVASKRDVTGSVTTLRIRGISSISNYNIPFVILDGVPYEGDLSKINTSLIMDGIILKGADAVALYGSKAANGVILLSTKGAVQLPKPEEPPVVVRKNFSETAFFFPQVHADNEGYYNISFVIPESVTEWKWKLLAHTKNAKFITTERSIFTQLPMMVQPDIPRFLYQGDKIILQTRITNLDTADISGNINCTIEDAVTGEDITSGITANKQQPFSVSQKSNSNASFIFSIPGNLLHPVKVKITARAGSFSDGEEHIIPILSKKILVSQNVPFILFNKKDTSIATPALPDDAEVYGIGMYISPKPQAAIVNALPYLAFYPYNCAEQTFNKLLAHSTAVKILRTDTAAQQIMQSLGNSATSGKKQEALPDELSDQTMPWLQLNHATTIHQKRLLQLFDTLSGNVKIEQYITELKNLQNSDGGITWFKGGKSSNYISNYILSGFGKLQKDKLPFIVNRNVQSKLTNLLPSLISYCDAAFADTSGYNNGNALFYLNARSYWIKDYPVSDNISRIANVILTKAWKNAENYSLNEQASLISASLSYQEKYPLFGTMAVKQLESIRQLAISDNINGLRWKDISNSDDLNNNGEETIVNLAKAFEEIGDAKKTVNGIIKWLLNAKQGHNWSTTKSTAAVAGLLQRNHPAVTGAPVQFSASINNASLYVTDNLLKGELYSFSPQQQFAKNTIVKKDNETFAGGGFNYYYFTANPPIIADGNAVKISKRIYRLNSNNQQLEAVNENTILKIADKLKTIITIDAPKQLKYVFIDEKRATALEPKDASSGYEYSNGFSYYKSVKDIGYQFFAEIIPSGISTIEYETVVASEGVFSNGPVALQCMYQPQVRAYGSGIILQVNK